MASLPSPPFLPIAVATPTAASANPRKSASPPSGSDPKRPWWGPLFRTVFRDGSGSAKEADPAAEGDPSAAARRRAGLTAEKARVLRRETRATATWHDAMYHSAIASRLAFPDEDEA
ncbi:uncharacterized protein [Typha angustifolia]|uniref:uncharacterized protein n=1 Tax=Typha angustifolia TaxID=59011 RepID=UPI003C2B3206